MTEAVKMLSKEKQINKIFAQIAGVPDPQTRIAIPGTGIAEPGDLLFFITHHSWKPQQDKKRPFSLTERTNQDLTPQVLHLKRSECQFVTNVPRERPYPNSRPNFVRLGGLTVLIK